MSSKWKANLRCRAPVLYVKGRQHPVKIYYTKVEQEDYLDSALRTFFQIHEEKEMGDVLIFLPGNTSHCFETSSYTFAHRTRTHRRPGVHHSIIRKTKTAGITEGKISIAECILWSISAAFLTFRRSWFDHCTLLCQWQNNLKPFPELPQTQGNAY